jgi:hypothetical protein
LGELLARTCASTAEDIPQHCNSICKSRGI